MNVSWLRRRRVERMERRIVQLEIEVGLLRGAVTAWEFRWKLERVGRYGEAS